VYDSATVRTVVDLTNVLSQVQHTWTNRVPTLLITKIPGLSRTSEAFFQDPVISQQCLNIERNSNIERTVRAKITHNNWTCSPKCTVNNGCNTQMYYMEQKCVDAHILASASASLHPPFTPLTSKFQDLQDFALRFPGLSRSSKFYKYNSRTIQEAWEPWIKFLYAFCCFSGDTAPLKTNGNAKIKITNFTMRQQTEEI